MPGIDQPKALHSSGGRLVQGDGRFLDDIEVPGLLHCHFVRSVVAHAELGEIDISEAASREGVHLVATASDLALSPIPGQLRHGPPAPHMGRPPLAEGKVRYVGEPVAVVVAESPALAADASELVQIQYDELPAVVNPLRALQDEVILFEEAGTNVLKRAEPSPPSRDMSDIAVTIDVTNQRVAPLALEPLGMLADPTSGRLAITCGHQAPHRLKSQLATLLGIDPEQIRVTVPDVGGGFGAKGMLYPEYLVVAALALRLGRPVKWLATRREDLTGGIHGRAQSHRITLAGSRSGHIERARVELVADLGAYPHNGSMIPSFTEFMAPGPYTIEEVVTTSTIVVTNTAPIGTYRGAGRPEATYALERAIDAFADEVGMDPIEVRRANLVPDNAFPYTTFSGGIYDSGQYTTTLDRALKEVDVPAFRSEQHRRRNTGQPAIGLGLAFYLERAGGPITEGEYGSVEIDSNGGLTVRVGAIDTGQGQDRVWRSIAGKMFDLDETRIKVVAGDTDLVPEGVGTFASRSTQVCGSVVHRCSESRLDRVKEIAADMLEVAPDDIVARTGRIEVVDRSGVSLDLASIHEKAAELGEELFVGETWVPGAHTFPYGVHVAIVEVDTETGDVRLERAIAVDDCGTVIDPMGATGQAHGSLAQGIGQARFEAVAYDESGQPLTSSLIDYLAPRATDLPMFETFHVESPAPSNPLGAKGVGESGCIGFPPAYMAAVKDALRHLSASDLDMPLHPQHVWNSVQVGVAGAVGPGQPLTREQYV